MSIDESFDSDYMIKVSGIKSGMTLTFTNCVVDVRGNFFKSEYPVNLIFDGCTFLMANSTNLMTLDYSAGGIYGCASDYPST
jgi:hypothetical protein